MVMLPWLRAEQMEAALAVKRQAPLALLQEAAPAIWRGAFLLNTAEPAALPQYPETAYGLWFESLATQMLADGI